MTEQEALRRRKEDMTQLVYNLIDKLENDEIQTLVIAGKRFDDSYFFLCGGLDNPYEMHGFVSTRMTDLVAEIEAGDDDEDDLGEDQEA
jgi:hypothetical protein